MRHFLCFKPAWACLLSLILAIVPWFASPAIAQADSLTFTQPPLLGALFSFSGTRPNNLGIQDGSFAACPGTPNCVSSFSPDADHKIEPIRYTSTPEKAFADLKQMIQAQPRTTIITATENYLYAEFTSKLMGFVDDVEFYLDQKAGVIQVRSASRLGESDLGVNRQRVETIRSALKEAGAVA
jgi:uncharacterized protein (DUF1499 family)